MQMWTVDRGRTRPRLLTVIFAFAVFLGVIVGSKLAAAFDHANAGAASASRAPVPSVAPQVAAHSSAPAPARPHATQPTTTAGQQYATWYTRGATPAPATTAGEQYRVWYQRGARVP